MSNAYERAVARSEGRPVPPLGGQVSATTDAEPFDLYGTPPTTAQLGGSNGGPVLADFAPPALAPSEFDLIRQEIEDLFDEAKNFADGEPIDSEEIAAAVTKLYEGLHDAGKRADALRVEEKKPLDDQIDEIQARFNPLIQPKKGKVALGKEALGVLLAAWRATVAAAKEAEAAAKRAEADRLAAEAQAAIRSSAGNLEAREAAETLLTEAKDANKWASRAERKATTGTGLRTVFVAHMIEPDAALDWAFRKAPERFTELCQELANEAVRLGAREVPGFVVSEEKRAIV